MLILRRPILLWAEIHPGVTSSQFRDLAIHSVEAPLRGEVLWERFKLHGRVHVGPPLKLLQSSPHLSAAGQFPTLHKQSVRVDRLQL